MCIKEGVSIIVPVYNASEHINRLVLSVKKQTKKEWELILVDDGSIDDSFKCCERAAKEDKRIKAIHTDNNGPDTARMEGVRVSEQPYIIFLDADDTLSPDAIEKLYNCIVYADADIVISRFDRIWADGTINVVFQDIQEPIIIDKSTAIQYMIQQKYYGWELVAKIYKRKLFDGIEKTEYYVYMEDFYRNWYLFNQAHSFFVIPDVTYHYYQHNNSSTHLTFNSKRVSELQILHKINDDFRIIEYQDVFDELFIRKYVNTLCAWVKNGEDLNKAYKYIDYLKEKVSKTRCFLSVQNRAAVDFLTNYNQRKLVDVQESLLNEIKEYIGSHDKSFIYGAGKYASTLGKLINSAGIAFAGYIVSEGEHIPESPDNMHEVEFISEYVRDNTERKGIIIALSEKSYEAVMQVLEDNKVADFLDLRRYNFLLNC